MAGLREQRKAHTRAQIQQHGLRLIEQDGYARTSCEQIAAAAGVSAATLFRYFPTKEDIVLQDVYDPMIAEAVRARPAAEPRLTAVRRGLADAFDEVYEADLEDIRARTALILSVPALRARMLEQQEGITMHLARALADRREDTDAGRLEIRVAAGACAAALSIAVDHWAAVGGHLPDHVDAAMAALADLARGA
ncbi:MAG: TetR/AcrR family transcriptional regulator [Ornithinimicrobium sp.]|uniref:TetR/AcrR family transcriptional regulator n=1 Tax=Ornithinimicrobium sp. TaxID=1977084 RepID=UPI003D9B7AB3